MRIAGIFPHCTGGFLSTWQKLESPGEREPQCRNCLYQIGLYGLMDVEAPAHSRRYCPKQVIQKHTIKQTEQEMGSKPVLCIPPWSLLWFRYPGSTQVPALASLSERHGLPSCQSCINQMKAFHPKSLFVMVFII